MKQKNLELFNLAQRYKSRKRTRYSEKAIYDCRTIAEEAKHSLNLDICPVALSRFLFRAKQHIRSGLRKGQYLKGKYLGKRIYEQTNRIFGNVNGKRGFNSLGEEIQRLVLAGEPLEYHQRDLSLKYHLPYKIIKDEWSKAEKPLEGLTPEQIEALRKLESLSDSRPLRKACQPIYERRFKNSPRDWRTLPEGAVLDFLKPYYSDPLALLNQGRILKTPSASYHIVPPQAVKKTFPERDFSKK